MPPSSGRSAPRNPAADLATPFTLQSMRFIYCCCVIPLCLLISSGGVSDELNEILMRVSPRRERGAVKCEADWVQSDACWDAHAAFVSVIDEKIHCSHSSSHPESVSATDGESDTVMFAKFGTSTAAILFLKPGVTVFTLDFWVKRNYNINPLMMMILDARGNSSTHQRQTGLPDRWRVFESRQKSTEPTVFMT